MKSVVRAALTVASIILVGAATAHAQLSEPLTFTTTFSFTAGNTVFPAGHYTVQSVADDPLAVELSDGRVGAFLELDAAPLTKSEPVKDEVVFNRYGQNYVLSEIWDAETMSGLQATTSYAERRQAMAHGKPSRHSVPATKKVNKS
jgi:hypothetical protein